MDMKARSLPNRRRAKYSDDRDTGECRVVEWTWWSEDVVNLRYLDAQRRH